MPLLAAFVVAAFAITLRTHCVHSIALPKGYDYIGNADDSDYVKNAIRSDVEQADTLLITAENHIYVQGNGNALDIRPSRRLLQVIATLGPLWVVSSPI